MVYKPTYNWGAHSIPFQVYSTGPAGAVGTLESQRRCGRAVHHCEAHRGRFLHRIVPAAFLRV